jgi:hypothetical protein
LVEYKDFNEEFTKNCRQAYIVFYERKWLLAR